MTEKKATETTTSAKTANAAFRKVVNRGKLGKGLLKIIWRLNYNQLGNQLKPSKPMAGLSSPLKLDKGDPVMIVWPEA